MPRTGIVVVALACATIACSDRHDERAGTATRSGSEGGSSGAGAAIATYGGKRFTTEDFRRELERLPPRSRAQITTPERKRQFVENLILNELLVDEGRAEGYDRDPEITRQVDDLRKRLIVQRVMKEFQEPPSLSDEQVQTYYDQHRRLFSGAQVRAAHILVKDEELTKQLREQLRQDPAKFEELARAHSTDTATAARGGDLGFFGQGRMVSEFEQAAFGLEKPGDISEIVKTPFGFHIIKLLERKEGADRPFAEVKDRIRVTLLNQRRQEETQSRMDAIKSKANIQIDDAVLASTEVPPVGTGMGGVASPGAARPSPAAPPPGSGH